MEKEEMYHRICGILQMIEIMQSGADQGIEIGEDLLDILYREVKEIKISME